MAEMTYRDAVARGIAQEMERDPRVILIGEDVAEAGGRVQDHPGPAWNGLARGGSATLRSLRRPSPEW